MCLNQVLRVSSALILLAATNGCGNQSSHNSAGSSEPPIQTESARKNSVPESEEIVVTPASPAAPTADVPEKLETTSLPNSVRIHSKVISGGQPEGDAAFSDLQKLGIKTIISVDGAKPDLDLARKYGMKYVHLPHSYDGIPEHRVKELARAVRDLQGPIYIHCHHGKHRSPAAAAVACVSAGLINPSVSMGILSLAGTNPNYRGLYQSASAARRIEDSVLDMVSADFPETAVLTRMADAMVHLEHTYDRIGAIAKDGWKTSAGQPHPDAAHEALLLKEHFTELLRTKPSAAEPEPFFAMLKESEQASSELEALLRQSQSDGYSQSAAEMMSELLARVTKNCSACHQQFRDLPLSEKTGNAR
jgi:protein tyrosine phosphatase (PTP) superfamily phosphohydrolase (DUF442 family)